MSQRGRAFILTFFLAVLAATAQQLQIPLDGYAAIVGDKIITIGEVLAYMRPIEAQLRETYIGDELQQKLMEAFVKSREMLIEEALILADFESRGASIPENLIDERVNLIVHERFDDDRAAFLEALASQRMSYEEMRNQVRDALILMIMRRQEVTDRVQVAPKSILEAYEANMDRYREPGRVHLRMISINKGKTDSDQAIKLKEAEDIVARLREGKDFAEVARQVSEDNKAQLGGDWGWLDPDTLQAELAEVIKSLKVSQISDVVPVGDALYILCPEARKEATVVPFEDVRATIEREVRIKEEERLYREWINRLRDKFYIQVISE